MIAFSKRRILSPDQLYYDSDFDRVPSFKENFEYEEECIQATLLGESYKIPIMNENYDENIMFYMDKNGYFVENVNNGYRSKSFDSIDDISRGLISYISKGNI